MKTARHSTGLSAFTRFRRSDAFALSIPSSLPYVLLLRLRFVSVCSRILPRVISLVKIWRTFHGDEGTRTPDLRLAKAPLSQLSYIPRIGVGLARLEHATSRLSGVRSNQLSYRPKWGSRLPEPQRCEKEKGSWGLSLLWRPSRDARLLS